MGGGIVSFAAKASEKSDFWKWVAPAGETTHLKNGSEKSDLWKCIAPVGETTPLKEGCYEKGEVGSGKHSLHFSILAKTNWLPKIWANRSHTPWEYFAPYPSPPKSHIMQKIDFWPYLAIFLIIPITHSWLHHFQIFEKVFLGQPAVWDWWTLEASATRRSHFS